MPKSSLFDEYLNVQIEGRNLKALLYFWENLPSCQIQVLFNTSQWANSFEKAQSLFNFSIIFIICWWIVFLLSMFVGACVCVLSGQLYQRWFKSLALISSHWVSNRSFAPQIEYLFSLTGLSEIICSNSEKCKASGWQQLPSHTYVLTLSPLFPPADSHLLSFTF